MSRDDEIRDVVRRVLDEHLGGSASSVPAPRSTPRSTSTAPAASRPAAVGGETVAIGADHGGYGLKETLKPVLEGLGYGVRDVGTDSTESVDYPEFAHRVARLVATGACHWGIVVDGAGIGSAMTANKVPGVRAALCYDLSSAKNSREHNLANVLTLGSGLIGPNLARQIVETWLATPWGGDRHARRAALITEVEERYLRRNA